MSVFDRIKLGTQLSHINQLKQFKEIRREPRRQDPDGDKEEILGWIADQEQKGRIARAKANRNAISFILNNISSSSVVYRCYYSERTVNANCVFVGRLRRINTCIAGRLQTGAMPYLLRLSQRPCTSGRYRLDKPLFLIDQSSQNVETKTR